MNEGGVGAAEVHVPDLLAAFRTATGMGVRVVHPGDETPLWACENAFCQSFRQHHADPPCRTMLKAAGVSGPPVWIRRCAAGLEHVVLALPGPAGPAGWIETGQVFLHPPQRGDFDMLRRRLSGWREGDARELEPVFRTTPVVTRDQLAAGIKLLQLVAREIELLLPGRDPRCRPSGAERIRRAKRFVEQHLGERIHLAEVAASAGLGSAHFCRLFKRETRETLGEFIARARVERAKTLLTQDGGRAIDVAYAAGFQSVRQFNHVFKALTRLTPTEYRRLPDAPAV